MSKGREISDYIDDIRRGTEGTEFFSRFFVKIILSPGWD